MTPTPEVDERARALRQALWAVTAEGECLPVETLPDWCFTAHASCDCRDKVDAILRAIVTELGITQEHVDAIRAIAKIAAGSLRVTLNEAADALSTLLAAGGSDE